MAEAKRESYKIEISIHASPSLLYSYISTPEGLSEWFAEMVNPLINQRFEFTWDGSKQIANVLKLVPNKMVKFQWVKGPPDEFFEIEIIKDEMTNDVALVITDFSDSNEKEENIMVWESQVHVLREKIGA
jgi:uncharacterized protein YndB with AHSA1/START domain